MKVMKTRLILLGVLAGAGAFGQATGNGQFNERPPLFRQTPVTGFEPAPPTNLGRTNIFNTNRFAYRTNAVVPGLTNRFPGLTSSVPPGANVPGEIPTLPGTPPSE